MPAGELRVGETLRNLDGDVRIESIEQLGTEERVYNLEIHGEHVFRVASSGVLVHNSSGATGNTPSNTALPESYWINKKAPTQIAPGTRTATIEKPSSKGGTYSSTTHYDEYGRQVGQTHRTHHGYSDPTSPQFHPNPHHHRRDPITGEQLRDPSTGSRTWPGEF